jgi:1-deoxy-D-xylulose-5-phosphate synthase
MAGDNTQVTSGLLETIQSPDDLKDMSVETLGEVAQELREFIIESVSRTGGHLASSLGVVELTLAMLKVFSPPKDRVVFDVGHQAYAYKILTGRRDAFHTLRQQGGISGFPKRSESPYDFFDVGHAGNAISVAAGLAKARCFNKDDHKVIAVVGDGSLTCGVSYEGLNQAGDANKDLIIILNDNEMSISPNVGAMAAYLNRIMTGQLVTRFRDEVKNILKNIPGTMGRSMYVLAKQMEDALKGFVTPGRLFEDLGFTYVGPIDGHKIHHLIDTFQNVKRFKEPVLIHTVTCKGKGYCLAEDRPSRYHGVGPFDIETGESKPSNGPPTYTSVFGKAVTELAEKDDRIVTVTAAMKDGTGLKDFAEEHPDRFFDVGIAEQHAVVFAAGLAAEGLKPVVAIYSTFLQRAYDHIIHDVCMQEFPVVFAMDRGGVVGEDGPTHHGVFDIAFMRSIPGMISMAPSDENELVRMLHTAVRSGKPCSIRYPRGKGTGAPINPNPESLPIGKGRVVKHGSDLLIVALGSMVVPSVAAAEMLASQGVSVEVIDARFIKPLDAQLISERAAAVGNVLTVEEGTLQGGFGGAVAELLAEQGMQDVRLARMGIRDAFVEHGTRRELLDLLGLNADGIARTARDMLNGKYASKLRCIS